MQLWKCHYCPTTVTSHESAWSNLNTKNCTFPPVYSSFEMSPKLLSGNGSIGVPRVFPFLVADHAVRWNHTNNLRKLCKVHGVIHDLSYNGKACTNYSRDPVEITMGYIIVTDGSLSPAERFKRTLGLLVSHYPGTLMDEMSQSRVVRSLQFV